MDVKDISNARFIATVKLNNGTELITEPIEADEEDRKIFFITRSAYINTVNSIIKTIKDNGYQENDISYYNVRPENEDDIIYVSKHAFDRTKERYNWKKKTSLRMIKKALENGEKVDNLELAGLHDPNSQYITYGDMVVVLQSNIVITVYNPKDDWLHIEKERYDKTRDLIMKRKFGGHKRRGARRAAITDPNYGKELENKIEMIVKSDRVKSEISQIKQCNALPDEKTINKFFANNSDIKLTSKTKEEKLIQKEIIGQIRKEQDMRASLMKKVKNYLSEFPELGNSLMDEIFEEVKKSNKTAS